MESLVLVVKTQPSQNGYTFKESPYSSHSQLLSVMPGDGRGRKVLDVGCASGYLGRLLADRGYEVTGIERPGGAGSDFPENVRLIEHDLEQGFPSLAQEFDYVICADILEHLRDPASLLRQIWAVLKPTGLLVASLPNSGNFYFRLNILLGRFPQDDKGLFDRTHLHFYFWYGWKDLLSTGGFTVAERRLTGVPVGLAVPSMQESAIVKAAEGSAYLAAKIWPSLFAYQFVITARPEAPLAKGSSS